VHINNIIFKLCSRRQHFTALYNMFAEYSQEIIIMENLWFAFLLTLLAGLSTGVGGLIAFFSKTTNTKFLSYILGFSAGVMIYVSFVEILSEAQKGLVESLGETQGEWAAVLAFFTGILIIALIDKFVPSEENPHELHKVEEYNKISSNSIEADKHKLKRMGIFTALAIAIHNFPEGFATFLSVISDPAVGTAIAIAIAIHNIPEGIAVSIPIYYATGSRKKALWYSFLSGLAEPAGAVVGYLILRNFLTDTVLGISLAVVAGIMVFISFDELLPTAQKYGELHLSIYGLVTGMIVMALSLLIL
jgi:zinc transporter, ZIP family